MRGFSNLYRRLPHTKVWSNAADRVFPAGAHLYGCNFNVNTGKPSFRQALVPNWSAYLHDWLARGFADLYRRPTMMV